MTDEDRALLSAVSEAVLVATGTIPLEGYAHWEELVDALVDCHERLNNLKPSTGATRER